jgi:hypothetical protein
MSLPPSGPGQGHRYRTEDPYDKYAGAGYGSSYGTDGPGHRYGERYDLGPADGWGHPSRYDGPAYRDAYGPETPYGAP